MRIPESTKDVLPIHPGACIHRAAEDFEAYDRQDCGQHFSKVAPLDQVTCQRVPWLWPVRIPLGKLTCLVGDPEVGKSFLSMDLAARVSSGRCWPDDPTRPAPRGHVLLLNAEDGLEDTVVPRLHAAGADLARVSVLTMVE